MSASRTRARRRAVQAIYQWQLGGQDVSDIESQFVGEYDFSNTDVGYFRELLRQVTGRLAELDAELVPQLDRPLREVDPVECAILRLAVYELRQHPEIPYRVVINEAVELAKMYGAEQGHRYVNSVVDKIARRLRALEIGAKGKTPAKRGGGASGEQ